MSDRPPAVLLGGGVVALSVARSLSPAGVPVVGLGHRGDPLRHSRHRRAFVDTGNGEGVQERWLRWLEDEGPRTGAVLACCDDGLELVARNRARLEQLGYAPPEADDRVLLAMLDKAATAELALRAGVGVPRTAVVSREDVDGATLDGLAFPCALKPRHSHLFARHFGMRQKLFVVESRAELAAKLAALPGELEMIATEIVPGPDSFCSYYSYIDERGEPLLHYTKRKLRQYPTRFGLGTYHRSHWDPEVAEVGLRFFRAAGLRGLACVEFKRDERDGELKLIECNHRFTAADSLVQASGIDLARLCYDRALGIASTAPADGFRSGVSLWSPVEDARAFLEYRRRGELTLGGWLRSVARRQRFAVASVRDPLPWVVATARLLGRALRRLSPGRQG